MGFGRLLARRPLVAAVVFEGLLTPLALVLALAAGVRPWADLVPSGSTLPLALLATLALVACLSPAAVLRPQWFRDIEALMRPLMTTLFARHRVLGVLAVSALAGLGEELLMRGVLQAWLAQGTGPWLAVAAASLVFGLVHYLSHVYFLLATAMGLYLGVLYQVTGDLALVSLVHGLYDAIAITYLLRRAQRETHGAPEAV